MIKGVFPFKGSRSLFEKIKGSRSHFIINYGKLMEMMTEVKSKKIGLCFSHIKEVKKKKGLSCLPPLCEFV